MGKWIIIIIMTIDDSRVSRRMPNLRNSAMPDYEQVKKKLQPFALWSVSDRPQCVVLECCTPWNAPLWTHEHFWIINENRIRRRRLQQQQRRPKPVIKIESLPAVDWTRIKSIVLFIAEYGIERWREWINFRSLEMHRVEKKKFKKIFKIIQVHCAERTFVASQLTPANQTSYFTLSNCLHGSKNEYLNLFEVSTLCWFDATPSNASSNRLLFGCMEKKTHMHHLSSHVVRQRRFIYLTLVLVSRFTSISVAHCFWHVHSISQLVCMYFRHNSIFPSTICSRCVLLDGPMAVCAVRPVDVPSTIHLWCL